jgi:hypothetical protein
MLKKVVAQKTTELDENADLEIVGKIPISAGTGMLKNQKREGLND